MRSILVLAMLIIGTTVYSQNKDSLLAVFWNLENFFDYRDGGTSESDADFSTGGSRHWTSKKFYKKCEVVCKSLFWIGDRYGNLPDVIGVAEVENRWVLERLLSSTLLRKYEYKIVHRDSQDRRGIDVALLYRKGRFQLVDYSFCVPSFDGVRMSTRDILHVKLRCISDGSVYDFIVNHHPSKFGGSHESEGRRVAAMEALVSMCDSLKVVSAGLQSYKGIIAMGDFNDTPDGSQFEMLADRLENTCLELFAAGEGTIRYEGKWDLIDMFWVSPSILSSCACEVLRMPFLMTRDRKHPGEKPLRTYSGPRYIGGVSDHCPVVLQVIGN
jgi:endonuclease/exonuclease/phosphatase family metal-dependent hydrolase